MGGEAHEGVDRLYVEGAVMGEIIITVEERDLPEVVEIGVVAPTGPTVLTAPNGSRWQLVVSNTGALSTVSVP
jgi:hypothetical protein